MARYTSDDFYADSIALLELRGRNAKTGASTDFLFLPAHGEKPQFLQNKVFRIQLAIVDFRHVGEEK